MIKLKIESDYAQFLTSTMSVFGRGVARRLFALGLGSILLLIPVCMAPLTASGVPAHDREAASQKPNIIFILGDDLAMGDLACFGQKKILTPNLDRMAQEGMKFTQFYSGTSLCAPSRASLMTGLHMGHCPIRANRDEPEPGQGQMPLPAQTMTVAKMLQSAGYATACTGKWGLGMFDTTGSPLKMGFDHFFGYNCQRHAHNYFPIYLYSDDQRIDYEKRPYAPEVILQDSLAWIRKNSERPFFLYFATTLPHGGYQIDDLGEYKDRPWSELEKTYAAMVTRLDSDVGKILALLKELGIDKNTLVVFSAGDNGSAFQSSSDLGKFFHQDTEFQLRGSKNNMYEGALRQGALVRWPERVPAGKTCNEPWAFWDFAATCADLIGIKYPGPTDGVSVVPVLMGGAMPKRDYFYWELDQRAVCQAARFGQWKAVRLAPAASLELYDLSIDPGEKNNLAQEHPELVTRAEEIFKMARDDSPNWPIRRSEPPALKKK